MRRWFMRCIMTCMFLKIFGIHIIDFQAHVTFQRETDLSHEVSPLSIEYFKELLSVGPYLDGVEASTYLVDTCCRELVHPSSSYTFKGEHWVKCFFLLVPKEEQEAPTLAPVDLNALFPSQQQLR